MYDTEIEHLRLLCVQTVINPSNDQMAVELLTVDFDHLVSELEQALTADQQKQLCRQLLSQNKG